MLDVPAFANLIWCVLSGGPFPHDARAVDLLLGTCAQESAFTYTTQIGGGPALGYFQCEKATETDLWSNYLCYQPDLTDFVVTRSGVTGPNPTALEHNMVYQIILARLHYYRCDPFPLPDVGDVEECASRWKQYYNTPLGHGTESQYIASYQQLVVPHASAWAGRIEV